jgi:hypothetical protein
MVSNSVSPPDRLVFPKLLDENIWLGSVAAAEDRPCVFVKEPNFVFFLRASSEIATIAVIDQRKNTAANGNARTTRVTSFLTRLREGANLGGLLDRREYSIEHRSQFLWQKNATDPEPRHHIKYATATADIK